MSKRMKRPKPVTGYAYVGTWSEPYQVGWCGVSHVCPSNMPKYPDLPTDAWEANARDGERAYLCRVTVVPLYDKKGRPFTVVKRKPETTR